MKRDYNKGFYSEKWSLAPPPHCALNGLGILCLGTCYRRFTILWYVPNGVSKEHFAIILGPNCSLDTGMGGGGGYQTH